jgi:glycosyltransferase involved in cell wall biosynthesis
MKSFFDIILPTWNNPQYIIPCVQSIHNTGVLSSGLAKLIVIDNGDKVPVHESVSNLPNTVVIKTGKNLGWEGGLKEGLKHSDAPFVCFQNDDTLIPKVSQRFYQRLLSPFNDDNVGIVGPVTTTASGIQSIFHPQTPMAPVQVPWVIFFCAMLRRSDLEAAGGIDDTLPGGDDFDMSIRIGKLGKKILINPECFLIHHGFVTGTKVHGDHTVKNGWNNIEFTDKVNLGLIKKHGFKTFIKNRMDYVPKIDYCCEQDLEGNVVRTMVNGDKNIVELGCGGQKTVPNSIGVDRVPRGEQVPNLLSVMSKADIVADVQKPLPFEDNSQDCVIVRHVLEHCVDSISTIKNWKRFIKIGGKLVIAVPDEKVTNGIPMNQEHVHAFTEESLNTLMETLGFKTINTVQTGNGISFVGCYEKL